jgi:hypothetical protein
MVRIVMDARPQVPPRPLALSLVPLAAVAAEIRRDRLLHGVVVAYAAAAFALALTLGCLPRFVPLLYVPLWVLGLGFAAVFYFLCYEIPRAARRDPTRPLQGALRQLADLPMPRLLAGAALFLSVAVFYGTFTSVKNMLPEIAPFYADRAFADLDLALHGGVDPWVLLQPVLGHQPVTRAVEILYSSGWTVLLYAVPGLVAMLPAFAAVRRRFFLAFFAIWIVQGNLVALAGLSAGPAFFGAVAGDAARFAPLLDYLSFSGGMLHSASAYQQYLWSSHLAGTAEFATGISAFPSLHVAMATLYVLFAWPFSRRVASALVAFWLVILAGSVHLGWHYAVDGYAAALLTVLIWQAAGRLARDRSAAAASTAVIARASP